MSVPGQHLKISGRAAPTCQSPSNYLWEDPPDEDKFSVCVHCGMCLEACPTYLQTGHEHQSPRGRVHLIKAVAQGKMEVNEAFEDPVFTCLDCRACETACPAGVQVGALIEEARGQIRQAMPLKGWKGWLHNFFLRGIFPYPSRLQLLGQLLKFYQKSGLQWLTRKLGLLNILPAHMRDMENIMPPVATPVLKRYPTVVPAQGETKLRVGLLTGCVMDVMFSDINEATIRVLSRNGYEVVLPKNQTCCGALHVHAGDREKGKELARQNIDAFLSVGVDKIIVNAAGCGCALKEYAELLHHDERYKDKAYTFAAKVEDVSKFLYENGYEKPKGTLQMRMTYHDACHLAHGQGVRFEPRQLLKEIPGVELVEMSHADTCCGSAGIYNLTNPEMAGKILTEKMQHVPQDVELISMGNPGCMLQMAMGVLCDGRNQRVVHTVQVLDWAYQQSSEQNDELDQDTFKQVAPTKEVH
ncbi:glycolate oxidase iron-sulfur subunit [Caldalkalibacillus uzonensis]|uniref:Glycolate oxidase iron-sulfur subunit n=1 Tax=Caldalkalibacillus uzonensis TaxID=353224 RepID=A0ABU0CMF4_9BACI|nr:(Fe-S)-binding protein [Caldalkalibacillus uzonensis]MDQ0337598.1 glycolate oxidase iron-sulfur subunit [Caldalkalibacillus uzonensis]